MKKLKKLEKEDVISYGKDLIYDNILMGKFRVFHRGHLDLLDRNARVNHIVFIGSKESLPLRIELAEAALSYIGFEDKSYKLWWHPDGYIPSIICQVQEIGNNQISAGEDRLEDYIRQIESTPNINFENLKYREIKRRTSSTEIIETANKGYSVEEGWLNSKKNKIILSYGE